MSEGERQSTPPWVWIAIALLACLQPAAHLVCAYFPPEGMVPTGLHIPDSALFIQSMDMLQTGFHSPYASVFSEHGANHWTHFSIPHLWLYAVQGQIADLLGLDHFLAYGFFNGLAAAIFLWAVYRFFVAAQPKFANRAFLLFALGGGLGGLLWLVSSTTGLHDAPTFEGYFWRFAIYELVEGAHLFPATYYARSYYTLSLAGCVGALTIFIHAFQIRCPRHALLAGIVLLPAAFLNARYGVFTLSIALLIFIQHRHHVAPIRYFATLVVMGFVGVACSYALMATGPAILRNHVDVGDMQMHFSPFIVSTMLLLPFAAIELWRRRNAHNPFFRIAIHAGIGYIVAFAALFSVYQIYMGNVLVARDSVVATVISDWSLIGACIGVAFSFRSTNVSESSQDWIPVWFLGFTCLAISAFGQGWYLQFGPQRLTPMVFIALCLVAAPHVSRGPLGAITALGTASILISTFIFQSPLGWNGSEAAFAKTHVSTMKESDAHMLNALRGDRFIAAGPIADVIALQGQGNVFHGVGSFNMSDQPFVVTQALQELFFDPNTSAEARHTIMSAFQIDHVVCSSTWPVDPKTINALEADPAFSRAYDEGDAIVFAFDTPTNSKTYTNAEAVLAEVQP